MKGFNLLLSIGLLLANFSFSQDVHLSQFYSNDQLLNPAVMGNHLGDLRVAGNYRNQWRQINRQSITTFIGAFDKAFRFYTHEIDGGVMIIRDQFSGFKTQTIKFMLAGAYGRQLGKFNVRAGLQAGIVSNSTDLTKQTFPSQWDYQLGQINPDASNMETNLKDSHIYFDLNIGGYVERKIGNTLVTLGLALNHLNRPKDTYFEEPTDRRKVRKVTSIGSTVPLTKVFDLQPKVQWMWTTKANELLFGSNLDYKTGLPTFQKFWLGGFFRHGVVRELDALYPVIGTTYKRFDIGLSYDINISELSAHVKRVRSFELSVIYTQPSSKLKYRIIPCTRY